MQNSHDEQGGQGRKRRRIFPRTLTGAAVILALAPSPIMAQEQLIGTIEGPSTVLDATQFPVEFQQSPMLEALVQSGALPPITERLPIAEHLLVVAPLEEVGTYSDTPIRRQFTGPGDDAIAGRFNRDTLLAFNPDQTSVGPGVALSIDGSDDGTVWTLHLREGLKWSDGEPLTSEDFTFWYEHVVKHPEFGNSQTAIISVGGELGTIEAVDDYTVKYTLPQPNFVFPELLAGHTTMTAPFFWGSRNAGGFAPSHYLEQFHPAFVEQAALDELAAASGFDTWALMFVARNSAHLNPDLPVVTPWRSVTPANEDVWVLERNPYFYGVDTAGNQLPYIDRIVHTLTPNIETINLNAIAGEIDFQARHIAVDKLPLLIDNQERSGYQVHLDPAESGANAMIAFNMSYEADPVLAELFANVDFRRALALGIDREQINETFFLGIGVAGSIVPADTNQYNPGPEFRTLWAEHDLETANQMLDGVGLGERDADGYRLRPDGSGRLRLELAAVTGSFVDYAAVAEMVRQHWADIGIDANVQQMDRTLFGARNTANENQLSLWDNGNSERLYSSPLNLFPSASGSFMGPLWGAWFASGGQQGTAPSETMQEVMAKWQAAFTEPSQEERVRIGREIWSTMADQVWNIGLVGVAPAVMGVRIAKTDLGNVPSRQLNNTDAMTPGISRPETFFWKP